MFKFIILCSSEDRKQFYYIRCQAENAPAQFKELIPVFTPGPPFTCREGSSYHLSQAEVESHAVGAAA